MKKVNKVDAKKEVELSTDVAVMKATIDIVRDDVKTIKYDLKDFMETADKKYATNKNLDVLSNRVNCIEKNIKQESSNTNNNTTSWAKYIMSYGLQAVVLIVAIIALVT